MKTTIIYTCLIFLLVISVLAYKLIEKMNFMIQDGWKLIITQNIPHYISKNPYLNKLLHKKMQSISKNKVSYTNLLYTYFSKKAIIGDPRWSSFEKLCEYSLLKIPYRVKKKFDSIVAIASGGAFMGPIIAENLGISEKNVHFVHLSKWSSDETNLGRLKLIMSDKKSADKSVIVKKWLKKDVNLHNKNVLIVDDQVCSGSTLRKCRELVRRHSPLSVKTMVISSSGSIKKVKDTVDYVGYEGFIYMWPFGTDS